MIEQVLARRGATLRVKVTVKSLISLGIIVLAVALPQLVHLALGAEGGAQWLPMYLPILLGGCLLGWKWGLGVGIVSPLISFAITSMFGSPMPALARLPYMVAELAVFGAISGLFSRSIARNGWMAFPAVLLAQVAGRLTFLAIAAIFQGVSPITAAVAWSQIQTGLLGMILQAVIIPFIVMGLRLLLIKDKE